MTAPDIDRAGAPENEGGANPLCVGATVLATACVLLALRPGLWAMATRMRPTDVVGGLALLFGAAWVGRAVGPPWRPRPAWAPVAVIIVGLGWWWLVTRIVETPTVAAVGAAVALYGVVGIWLSDRRWTALRVPFAILVCALPLGERAEDWLGVPARLAVAQAVYSGLQTFGVAVQSAETVLFLDRGLADVAAPCSGLRGLWSGLVVLLVVAAVERRRGGLRLAMVVLGLELFLLAGNVVRVTTLVVLYGVLGVPEWADAIHVPMGLTSFVGGLFLALLALRRFVPHSDPAADVESASIAPHRPAVPRGAGWGPSVGMGSGWGPLVAMSTVALLVMVMSPERRPRASQPLVAVEWPEVLTTTPAPVIEAERALAESLGQGRIDKVHFDHRGIRGQLLVLHARRWRAQHPPELCLRMSGHRIWTAADVDLGPHHQARVLRVDDGQRLAVYWYQRRGLASPNVWAKIPSIWAGADDEWVLVSLLFDPGAASSKLPEETLQLVERAVAASLAGHRDTKGG